MTRNIYLKGRMGKLFGEHHRLNCKTVQEAMHAIDVMKGGLRQYLIDCTENGVGFTVQKGEEFLTNQTAGIELGKDDIIITPIPQGSGLSDIGKIILGVILIVVGLTVDPSGKAAEAGLQLLVTIGTQLALAGIIGLTSDDPEELDEEQSTLFNGPTNTTKSGIPVPLCYGKMEVGGAVVNFGFTDYRITGNQGYTFVSKGTRSGSGSGGGGGGGGSAGGGDSDWMQEIMQE
jgi:predicted phage tail protein